MIKIEIKNKLGQQTHGARFPTQAEADAWIADNVANNSWGFPERWIKQSELPLLGLNEADAIAFEERETELGTAMFYKFAADYTIEQSDATAEFEAEQRLSESREAIALSMEIKARIRALNVKKLLAGSWNNAKWNQFKNDQNVNSAKSSLGDASLNDFKASMQAVSSEFYTDDEKAEIVALINAHNAKWGMP